MAKIDPIESQVENAPIAWFTLPNCLTFARMLMLPFLVVLTWQAERSLFSSLFIALFVLSSADGFFARRRGQVSELGAELDSWAVSASYIIVPLCALKLWPEIVNQEAPYIMAVVGFHVVPASVGLLKYSRMTSYNTWGSNVAAALVGVSTVVLMFGGPTWPFRIATIFAILAGIEEIFMTSILRQWEPDVPTIWHAMNIERAKVETALKESEEKYREVLANIEDGYFEVDLAGNLMFFNQTLCKYLGYTEDELLGKNNRDIMSESQAQKTYDTFNEVFRTGQTGFARDWEVLCKDGKKIFFELTITLIRNSRGKAIGFRCFGRDTTELKQAEEQARLHQEQLYQASKMVALGILVSGMAHDINNPNNFIMLNTPLLKEAWEGALPILEDYYQENGEFVIAGMNFTELRARIPGLFEGITDGSTRIKQIVDDLKTFVRKGTPDMTEQVDVNAVIKSSISLISPMIQKSTSRFYVNYADNLPVIIGNLHRLEQVVINLIQNACQALPNTQHAIYVTSGVDAKGRNVFIKVEDEGKGIPAESLPHISDAFYTTNYETGGVGLGLSITSKIVEQHGGQIKFSSQEGKGTIATVDLPIRRSAKGSSGVT